jgi:hypothetical protein
MADSGMGSDELRPLMFSIAYRMLGTVTDAEDVVQEAFLRLHASEPDRLRSVEAYAVTVTTRLAIDAPRMARRRRVHYVGPWLPEPLVESTEAGPAWPIEMEDTASVAFLVLLETASQHLQHAAGHGLLLQVARGPSAECEPTPPGPSPRRRSGVTKPVFAPIAFGGPRLTHRAPAAGWSWSRGESAMSLLFLCSRGRGCPLRGWSRPRA